MNHPSNRKYAHTLSDQESAHWEVLDDHLDKVAESAAEFAASFNARTWGEILGKCHDLGKLSDEFQDYLARSGAGAEDEETPHSRIDHSTYGARFVTSTYGGIRGQILAHCIAGHHAGLPDENSTSDTTARSTLRYRLDSEKCSIPAIMKPDITLPEVGKLPIKPAKDVNVTFQIAFFTRMLFSSLVDADRTRTEEFCSPAKSTERRCQNRPSFALLKSQLDDYLNLKQTHAPSTAVNQQRAQILSLCQKAANEKPGFFSLNVPTGGGKTLSSLSFAINHAIKNDLRRIIIAIPYTSIIEQTADVYRKALGKHAETALIEHHTNLQTDQDTRANHLGTENWDAPIVVTTNVQLFESLFAHRTTPCRKLHNIVGSVIILDEAQSIPIDLLTPTLAALQELVFNYGCTIVLCTATQPALEQRENFTIGLKNVRAIIPNVFPLFNALKRVEVHLLPKLQDDELANRLAGERSVLCIVNTRRHAARLYNRLAELSDQASCFHLSTWMCGAHRRTVLKLIRRRLKAQLPCRVVSTQLVEAGVDLDFPVVYRAEAGFDSIAQAAGRCNREGLLERGHTYVFPAEDTPPPGLLLAAAQAGKELFPQHPDPLAPDAIQAYFQLLYWSQKDRWDKKQVMSKMQLSAQHAVLQFREVSAAYQIIENTQVPVLVPCCRNAASLTEKLLMERIPFIPQRELQPYLVSVSKSDLRKLFENGFVQEHKSGVWILLNRSIYSMSMGLDPSSNKLDESLWSA